MPSQPPTTTPPQTLASECPEYVAWQQRARTSHRLNSACILFRTITLLLGVAIFIHALLYFPGISEIPNRLTFGESAAGIFLGLQMWITSVVQLTCLSKKNGYGSYMLFYWASIIDVWAMLYSFVVSVQIGIRLRLEYTTRGLWVLYLLSLIISAVDVGLDVSQLKLAIKTSVQRQLSRNRV